MSKRCKMLLGLTAAWTAAVSASDFNIAFSETVPEEKLAASELRAHLVRIYPDPARSPFAGKRILLGSAAGKIADASGLGTDGFIILGEKTDVKIAGGTPNGTLNGVYHFLEEVIGVRWLEPEITYYPQAPEIDLASLKIRYIPPFKYRVMYNLNAADPVWAQRQRVRHTFVVTVALGQHNTFYFLREGLKKRTGKTYTDEQAFKEHPEYFGEYEVNGKRERQFVYSQLCFSNSEVRKLIKEGMIARLDLHPDADRIDLSPQDGCPPCECTACESEYEKRGRTSNSKSDYFFEFFREAAAAVHQKYPDVKIWSLAYHMTQIPPNQYLGKNTGIRYAPIRMNVFRRFDEGKHNCEGGLIFDWPRAMGNLGGQIGQWKKLTDEIAVWYYTCRRPVMHPSPNLIAFDANVKFLRDRKIAGLFVEDLNWLKEREFGHLRSYLIAKLLWNPSYDLKKGIREFCELYYGTAADDIIRYLELVHSENSWDYLTNRPWFIADHFSSYKFWQKQRPTSIWWKWFYEKPGKHYYKERYLFVGWAITPPLKEEFFQEAVKLFDSAEAKVKNDPELLKRVRIAKLPVYFSALLYLPVDTPLFHEAEKEYFPAIQKIIGDTPTLVNNPKMADLLTGINSLEKIIADRRKNQ